MRRMHINYQHQITLGASDVLLILNNNETPFTTLESLYKGVLEHWCLIDTGTINIVTGAEFDGDTLTLETIAGEHEFTSIESDVVKEV